MSTSGSPKRRDEESALLIKRDEQTDTDTDTDDVYDYDSALEKAGFGKFHYILLLVCGLANASDAIEVLCISFLLPSAECELKLTSSDKGWLSAVMFIGMLVGGYMWGGLGDSFGRKKTLIASLFINAICGFISSFIQTKDWFLFMRFCSGVGVGGSIPVTWSYFAEFQPKSRRGSMLSIIASFWMIGNIIVAGLAWIIVPLNIPWHDPAINVSWRVFTAVCGIPALLAAIFLFFLPESPKYLLSKSQEHAALKILRKIHRLNNSQSNRVNYPVSRLETPVNLSVNRQQSIRSKLKAVLSNTLQLFTLTSVRLSTIKMLFINFAIAFGYYGLWLWFPELFNKLDQYYKYHPNETVSICEVTDFVPPPEDLLKDEFCQANVAPSNSVFINSFIISLAALPGNVWTIFHMDKLGRKFFLVLSMTLSGASAFLIYLVTSQLTNLIISCVFGLVSTMGFNALDCLGAELFPTNLRSTAFAVTLSAGRLGAILANIVFGYLITVSCAVPILSVAVLLVSGGLVGLLLPNTTNTALE